MAQLQPQHVQLPTVFSLSNLDFLEVLITEKSGHELRSLHLPIGNHVANLNKSGLDLDQATLVRPS